MTAGLLAAQPGGWTGAPSGDGGAAVPDAWLLLSDAAFAGLLPGYAFAQSVTQTLSLTAADNIGDGGTLELDGPRGIAVFESDGSTYAAVTVHDDNRVQILNVTDPSNVTAAGSIAHGGAINLDDPYGIATFTSGSSTYAAVAAFKGDGVQILDITDPSAITAAGNITNTDDLELDGAWDIATFTSGSSTYAAVAAFRDDGVQILDITDPSNVTETDSIAHGGAINLDGAWDIATFTSGSSTYAAVTASEGDGGVQILDITDPSAITAAGNIADTPSLELDGANGIAVFESGDSTYAAVAAVNDDGVQILDITDPSAITAAGNITDTPALELLGASGIAVFESGGSTYAAVAAYDDDSVQILDITDPSAITAAGNITDTPALELFGAENIATFTSGGSTYAAVAAYDDDGVQILRLTAPPPDAFVTTWETTGANQAITIPATGTYSIDWGDGTVNATASGTQTHNYASAGNHTVAITGGLESININSLPSQAEKDKLRSIDQWGNITWTTMASAFQGASNMAYDAADAPNLSGVTSMTSMFYNAHSFNGSLSGWDVSSVTDMQNMFRNAASFNQPLNDWNVSSVTAMNYMFYDADSFNGDLSGWDVSSVTSMISLFFGADSFNGSLSGWDVSSVTSMEGMFRNADSFNGNLSGWDVSQVTSMNNMFRGASSFNQTLNDWNVSSVTNMEGMFRNAASFDQPLNDWNVSSVFNMFEMFQDATSFNQPISDWDIPQVSDMEDMFRGAAAFNQDISTWDVSSVRFMAGMFTDATNFDQNLGEWYVVLNSTEIDAAAAPGVVGTISAQNQFLRGQSITYGIGAGGDSGSFNITGGSNLNMNITSPAKSLYTVNITSAGGFGFSNHRVYNVTVTGFDTNSQPTVNAGPDQTVDEGDTVTLSGTASDSDNDPLTYMWTHDSDLPITLADDTALSTTFTAPAVTQDTTVTFTLAVSDATDSVTDMVSVTITDSPGLTPTAADSITDAGALKLFGPRGIATFTSGGSTYAAVAAFDDSGVQILDITDPFNVTATDNIGDTTTLKLADAEGIAVFESGDSTYAAVTTYGEDGVQILDVTDPSAITAAGNIANNSTLELFGPRGIATFTSGGSTYAAVAAYDDSGVQILDITDPYNVTAAGSIANNSTLKLSGAWDIATFTSGGGTYAAVASSDDDGVQILNVTDPSAVTAAGSIANNSTLKLDAARGITTFTSGGSTYAAVTALLDDGVQILDVTDPSAITAAGSINGTGTPALDGALGIATFTSGGSTYAAVAASIGSGVQILNVTDPYDITAAGSITDTDATALELEGAGRIATFTSGGSTYAAVASYLDDGVQILRLVSGVPPPAVNSSPTVEAGPDQTVDEGDTVTLSGTASDSDNDPLTHMWTHNRPGLGISLADDTALSTTFTAPAVTQDTTVTFTLAVSDDTDSVTDMVSVTITDTTPGSIPPAVDAGPGLTAADSITDTETLKLFNARGIATFESGGGTYAAVTGYLDYGVQILDVTNPYGITAAASDAGAGPDRCRHHRSIADDAALELAGAWGVATFTSGGGTYAAVTAYFGDGVQILNVTDPSDITATDSIGDTETRELSGAYGIATFTSGSRTYAAVTALWDDDGVQILDVTNPSDITAAGSIGDTRTLELSGASDVATFTSGGRTYAAVAAYWDDGVQILDVTNPSAVTAAGSIGDTAALELDGAHGITTFTSGGRAYAAVAAYWDDGVQILDVTDPSAITAAGSITDDAALELDGAEGITVFESGGRTYAAVASVVDDGVQMLDVTDPSDIAAVGSITDDAALELLGASGIATFTSGGDTYAAVTAHFDSGVQILRLTGGGAILTVSGQFVGEPDNAQGFAESGTVIPRLAIRDLSVQVAPDSPPTVTSIERSDPAGAATSERTLVFAVTFSEDVTGVDLGDFALSPDSTGGGSAPGQFTQTSEPALRIADRSTIQDAITVDRSGTATSVSVAVDISHTYRGDLVIDLIAPDGTSQTLHSRTGGSANDIDRTYAPDFDGTGIAGDWTLRVSDRAGGDVGTLNGWTLTIGHGTAGSPVTGLTGSGDAYLVTVSAAQDGTYNLDLVSSGHGIADTASNPLTNTAPTGTDHTYTVSTTVTDSTAPTLASIERSDPSGELTPASTLVFEVTFSEDVTGVDLSDFALSSGGTGTGSVTNLAGSGSQCTS